MLAILQAHNLIAERDARTVSRDRGDVRRQNNEPPPSMTRTRVMESARARSSATATPGRPSPKRRTDVAAIVNSIPNITIYGNNVYGRRHLQDALGILRRTRDKYPFDRIVSHKFPLAEINEVLAAQDNGPHHPFQPGPLTSVTPPTSV